MRRIRVFVDDVLAGRDVVELAPFAAEHLTRVLRLGNGADVTCFNGDGHDYRGTLRVKGKANVAIELAAREPVAAESPLSITLAQAVARGEKMDFVLQKATELGVTRVVPLVSERTEVRLDEDRADRRLAHWRRVVQSACEQCGRARIPAIAAPQGIADFAAASADSGALKLVLHVGGERRLRELERADSYVLAVGPEGGFSARDVDALALAGFTRVALGPRVLRTETAGPAAIAALQGLYGDLG